MSQSEPRALLQELTRLETLRDPSIAAGKRQFERFVVRADAELHPMDRSKLHQMPVPILMRDLSRGGIGFVCSEPLDLDSTWHVSFSKDGFIIGSQAMIVRHSRLIKSTTYLIGGQFCINSGLLSLLGVRPASLRDTSHKVKDDADPNMAAENFLAPEDL